MSTGLKREWRDGDQWRTVAYLYYRNSSEWRHVLELNPSFDIRTTPAPAVNVPVSGPTANGSFRPSEPGAIGVLSQVGTNLDLRGPSSVSTEQTSGEASIWPWSSAELYVNRLGEYTAAGLLGRDRINGFSFDSPQAWSDTQRG